MHPTISTPVASSTWRMNWRDNLTGDQQTMGIYDITQAVFRIAAEDNCTTLTAADRLAERRIKALGEVKSTYIGTTVDRLGANRGS